LDRAPLTLLAPTLVLGLALGGLVPACRRGGDEELGLREGQPTALALDRLAEPEVLLAALRRHSPEVEGALGARGLDLSQTLELTGDDHGHVRAEHVEQSVHLDTDGKGAFHLARDLDHPDSLAATPRSGDDENGPRTQVDPLAQGMEAIALPGRLFVRARYGRFVERRAEPGELDRLRGLGERVLGDDLALLLRFASIADNGAGSVLGRRTRKLVLTRRPTPAAAAEDEAADPRRAWRASITVSQLDGELELDGETGAPLSARLEARYRVAQPALEVHLRLRQDTRAARAIAAPTDAIVNPHRPRPTVERNQLLEGLAPPVGPQAGRP
jgi:hypothetical protein